MRFDCDGKFSNVWQGIFSFLPKPLWDRPVLIKLIQNWRLDDKTMQFQASFHFHICDYLENEEKFRETNLKVPKIVESWINLKWSPEFFLISKIFFWKFYIPLHRDLKSIKIRGILLFFLRFLCKCTIFFLLRQKWPQKKLKWKNYTWIWKKNEKLFSSITIRFFH